MTESYEAVFVDGKYISKDTWYDRDGKPFSAGAANTNDEEATAMANALRVGDHIASRLS